MPRTRSGLRCDGGSVSGSASTASRSSAPANTTSAGNTQCHDACSSTAAPSDGATTGATPSTSISRDSTVAAADSANRSPTTAIATTIAAAAPMPCRTAGDPQHRDVRREHAHHRRQHVQHDAGHQRSPAAQRVRQRADDQLAERQPGQRSGQGELRDRRRHRQFVGDLRQRRQIHVDGQRPQRDQSTQHHDHPRAAGCYRARPRRSILPCKWLAR